jgi:hypothetical protein
MNPALLLLLLVPADVTPIPTAVVEQSYDLALLSHRQAQRLDGRRVHIRVDLGSEPGDASGAIVYDCASADDVNRTVWLMPGQTVKDVMTVEGVFRLLWRQPGNGFPGYWEYRVEGAVRRPDGRGPSRGVAGVAARSLAAAPRRGLGGPGGVNRIATGRAIRWTQPPADPPRSAGCSP